jgi:glycosyltransferase involved in cell wall biosynthesis
LSTGAHKVLMLTWEFPPRIIGGIASHVYDLSCALVRHGMDVHVVTCGFPDALPYEIVKGVHVYRFDTHQIPAFDFLSWVFSMNIEMTKRANDVIAVKEEKIDLIHAHDWLVARTAIELKNKYGKPLVSTIHSTEVGRRNGIHDSYQRTIHNVESQLVHQSDRLICCSQFMAEQISQTFGVPITRLDIIFNGVDTPKFNIKLNFQKAKEKFARRGEKLILYVGRLVYEKGVHVLIGALPKVLSKIPNLKLIIVGEGGMKESLQREAQELGVSDKVLFKGFVDDETLRLLYKISDVAVFPSLYEPSGIAALEAMAAGLPVVVSDVGGLTETVKHNRTGVRVSPDNSDSVSLGVLKVLLNSEYANLLRRNAYNAVVSHNDWDSLVEKTVETYAKVLPQVPRGPPIVSAVPKLESKISWPEQFLTEQGLLLVMHTSGTAKEDSSKTPREVAKLCGASKNAISALLEKLIENGFVVEHRDAAGKLRYYLTKTGIVRSCSMFT